ncbi:hypothetical protein PENSPDRAFT_688932 [Peniophora sp. CONT]|nr:hypothetical protein PENSPDRAFT_688932 [Peniophora sp. CONT]
MGRGTISVRSQAGSMPKTYAATSKHGAKAEGKSKLRDQLEAAGGTVTRTIRDGFVVEMSRVQRSVFMRDHPDTHLADLAVEGV